MSLPAFKAYDIRGRVPDELNEDLARRIGVALAGQLESGPVVVGHDVRLASQGLQDALSAGLRASGREVIDIGLCGTEEVYFQTDHLQAAGGVMVTASHNPMDYNGMKLVRENARPISSDTGLFAIRDTVAADTAPAGTPTAAQHSRPDKSAYIAHLLSYIDIGSLKPLKLVVNAGNGGAGAIVDLLAPHLPFEFVRVFHEPDGHFPNGIPNPLLPENREATAKAVKQHGADFGIAWDGDFDRCFFFDENGRFIEGYYLVGLLAQAILAKQPGGKVVHDPRLTWNTIEMVEEAGGVPVLCKSGHAFIKEKMRSENAVYGGEMSAHHYFREFAYADSGMIPWLLIAELVSQSGRSLADLVEARMQKFPCSGEINFKVADAKAAVARVMQHYAAQSPALDHTDGVSAEFAQWRFNLRSSNTEPLLRLNVETRGDAALLEQRTQEISDLLRG
ncbi:phosphoglucomutase/phosphomannomutase [Xanthomonas translucens]|uniref:phosphoglucomutase/phosphomannomutase n=1 Tax=Xanthomonas campestris pv. translucens TaxID=343 RepID=UPI0002A7B234|nr:phosphoglucomutase/phosphomannomutase [Xanthomonas translucens]AKK68964.1 phosphomannomutase [Xanthomonas translucens pv. undulosa]AVY67920.1 phosphomannomutase [Xanthomonas translucens pv. undulosa]ELQ15512.1 phosphoglucomutase/phosphomannomutase [Xanthomonas translucens DAR61454]KWV11502.1 phosphomannomutase [Xanthomonas translucens]MBC3971106.1 phosphomannomutase [Xanthomonas translucens pv. undulosa]